MSLRIVQLTDCHLFASRKEELRGIATWPRLVRVMATIHQQVPLFDWLIVTGDTAHDENLETYRALSRTLGSWTERCRIVPGNHDNRAALRETFPSSAGDCDERLTFRIVAGGWQLIGLDSQLPGELPGNLGAAQRDWLRRHLLAQGGLPTVLFLHHPPIRIGNSLLDDMRLQDDLELAAMLRDHPQVRVVLCGHVHQQAAGSLGSAIVLTSPAVGPQFRQRVDVIEVLDELPRWRLLELEPDGRWFSQVLE